MALHNAFRTLGFKDQEIRLYLTLVEVGKANAQALSKKLGIPRTTVYWLLETLIQHGLVSIEKKKRTTFFVANQLTSFERMVQGERKNLEEQFEKKDRAVKELVRELTPYFSKRPFSVPKFQFFEGKDGVRSMLYDYLPEWKDSMRKYDFTWWGYQDATFPELFMDWLKHTWKEWEPKEKSKILTNKAAVEEALLTLAPHRGPRFVPPNINFYSSIWVAGDYIVLIMTSHPPIYAFQIKEPLFAGNLRAVFQMLWENEKKSSL
jgi:predicted transcriptional regulator